MLPTKILPFWVIKKARKKTYTVCSHVKPVRLPTPPLNRQISVIPQKPLGRGERGKASTVSQGLTCPLASYPFSICHLARQCLSGYSVTKVHIGYFSAWGRRSSETLNTCHSQPRMRPYIIITTLLLHSLSFAPALLFFSFPSHPSSYSLFRQIW